MMLKMLKLRNNGRLQGVEGAGVRGVDTRLGEECKLLFHTIVVSRGDIAGSPDGIMQKLSILETAAAFARWKQR